MLSDSIVNQRSRPMMAAGACINACLFAVVLWIGWRKWPDVLIDFGRELYVPWRLAAGDVLYRDVAWFNGPLSAYLNSIWFALFGTGLTTLIIANIAIVVLIALMIYAVIVRIVDRFAAIASVFVFLGVFVGGQYLPIGNYNFITPYAHELTHGMAIALAAILLLHAWLHRPRSWLVCAVGAAVGLTFLTKAEVFLATILGITSAVGIGIWAQRDSAQAALRELMAYILGVAVPLVLAWALLAMALSPREALTAIMMPITTTMTPGLTDLPFYQRIRGTDSIAYNVISLAISLGFWVIGLTLVTALARFVAKYGRHQSVAAGLVFLGGAAGLFVFRDVLPWMDLARPWPIVLAVVVIASIVRISRGKDDAVVRRAAITQLALAIFALALLLKIMLNVRISHYGFALAMPATIVVVAAITAWLPGVMSRFNCDRGVMRAGAAAFIVALVAVMLLRSHAWYQTKDTHIGEGADRFVADGRGALIQSMLEHVREHSDSDSATLLVMPEGVMLNYLLRMENPTGYINFMPPEVMIFGEAAMLEAFRADPPDYIILIDRDTLEYGFAAFGHDYGESLFAWTVREYDAVQLVGAPPLRGEGFGLVLLERRR